MYKGPSRKFKDGEHVGPGEWLDVIRTINGFFDAAGNHDDRPFPAPTEVYYEGVGGQGRVVAQSLLTTEQHEAEAEGRDVVWPPPRGRYPKYIEDYPDFEVIHLLTEDSVIVVGKTPSAEGMVSAAVSLIDSIDTAAEKLGHTR